MLHYSRDQFLVPHVRPGVSGERYYYDNGMTTHQMLINTNISDENFRIHGLLHLESRLEVSATGAWRAVKSASKSTYNGVVNGVAKVAGSAKAAYDARQMRLNLLKRLKIAMERIQYFMKNSKTYMNNRDIFTRELEALTGILDDLDQFTHNATKVMLGNFEDDNKPTAPPTPASAPPPPPGGSNERERTPYSNPKASGTGPYYIPPFNPNASTPHGSFSGPPAYPPPSAPPSKTPGMRMPTRVGIPPRSALRNTTSISPTPRSTPPLQRTRTFKA